MPRSQAARNRVLPAHSDDRAMNTRLATRAEPRSRACGAWMRVMLLPSLSVVTVDLDLLAEYQPSLGRRLAEDVVRSVKIRRGRDASSQLRVALALVFIIVNSVHRPSSGHVPT